jgi:hypothetical protein
MIEICHWLHQRFLHFVARQPSDVRDVLERARFRILLEDSMSIWERPGAVAVCLKAVSES